MRPSDTNAHFSDEDILDSASNLGLTSNYIAQTQAPVNLITPSTQLQTVLKLGDTVTSSLTGTATVRERIQWEIQNSYDESLIVDQEKDEKRDRIERRQVRKNRLPQEPDIQEDHIVMSIWHPGLTTRRRIFRADTKMNDVYDSIGSLSLEKNFKNFSVIKLLSFHQHRNMLWQHSIWRK